MPDQKEYPAMGYRWCCSMRKRTRSIKDFGLIRINAPDRPGNPGCTVSACSFRSLNDLAAGRYRMQVTPWMPRAASSRAASVSKSRISALSTNRVARYQSSVARMPCSKDVLRRMPQVLYGERGVGLGVAHISFAAGSVVRRDIDAFDFLQQRPRLIQRDASAIATVEAHCRKRVAGACAAFRFSATTSST